MGGLFAEGTVVVIQDSNGDWILGFATTWGVGQVIKVHPLWALVNGLSLSWGHCAADVASNSIQRQADKCQSLTNLIMDAEKLIQKYWNCFYSIWFLYKNEILNFKK